MSNTTIVCMNKIYWQQINTVSNVKIYKNVHLNYNRNILPGTIPLCTSPIRFLPTVIWDVLLSKILKDTACGTPMYRGTAYSTGKDFTKTFRFLRPNLTPGTSRAIWILLVGYKNAWIRSFRSWRNRLWILLRKTISSLQTEFQWRFTDAAANNDLESRYWNIDADTSTGNWLMTSAGVTRPIAHNNFRNISNIVAEQIFYFQCIQDNKWRTNDLISFWYILIYRGVNQLKRKSTNWNSSQPLRIGTKLVNRKNTRHLKSRNLNYHRHASMYIWLINFNF